MGVAQFVQPGVGDDDRDDRGFDSVAGESEDRAHCGHFEGVSGCVGKNRKEEMESNNENNYV